MQEVAHLWGTADPSSGAGHIKGSHPLGSMETVQLGHQRHAWRGKGM
jgi:hypothetical protein